MQKGAGRGMLSACAFCRSIRPDEGAALNEKSIGDRQSCLELNTVADAQVPIAVGSDARVAN